MPQTTEQGLFPAEHRALRELQAASRQLAGHWARLARRLSGEPAEVLERGAAAGRSLGRELAERAEELGVPMTPSAQAAGRPAAGLRAAGDVLLERNQALRAAVLDAQHVTTLLAYLAALAETRGDLVMHAWAAGWRERLEELETAARAAAVGLARDPDRAIEPAEPSALGRAGHSVAAGLGTLGEAIDRSRVGEAVQRLRGRARI